jgi:hypothetical protein
LKIEEMGDPGYFLQKGPHRQRVNCHARMLNIASRVPRPLDQPNAFGSPAGDAGVRRRRTIRMLEIKNPSQTA